jgi:CspA family cold shock protein
LDRSVCQKSCRKVGLVKEYLMAEGVVKWFDPKKGYGFIEADDKTNVFVHHTSFKTKGLRTLNQGDKVSYEAAPGEKGPRAESVELLK